MESRPGPAVQPWLCTVGGDAGTAARMAGSGSFKKRRRVPAQSRESSEMRLIKAAHRAVGKARACYGGDPSRLLDICRARLIFGTAAGLAAGLGVVLDSEAVRVVRVRNSLREDCDAASTCGFRVCPPPAGSTCAPPVEALRWAPVTAPVFACACASPAVIVCFA